jgi:hypothetical protein
MLAFPLVAGVLVLGAGIGAERFFRPPPDAVRVLLAAPDRIESFAIAPELEGSAYESAAGTVAGHRILAEGRTAKGRRAQRIIDLLLDEESYRIGAAGDHKPGDFRPGHALRFVKGERSTVVLVCLSSARLTFEEGGGDFDPVARELGARIRSLMESKDEEEAERERETYEGSSPEGPPAEESPPEGSSPEGSAPK